jgi:predicted nucleic acid-binding protein
VILIDTNILIDVATRDPLWFAWSRAQLDNLASPEEVFAINDIVYAEMSVRYPDVSTLDHVLEEIDIVLAQIPREALFIAGRSFQRYRSAGGTRTGVLPDFFIGAHAVVSKAPLVTRDAQRFRTYFPEIRVISPDRN